MSTLLDSIFPMLIVSPSFMGRLRDAVSLYWNTLDEQANRQRSKGSNDSDRGWRSAVTGGKQMDGFSQLIQWWLLEHKVPESDIHRQRNLEIPGYFRPSKRWDMLVVRQKTLIAAIEFKSQRGPSFGNNLNNRTEEALGNATDLWTAYRENAFGIHRPWLGLVMLLEDCPGSREPVGVKEPHFHVFPEFRDTSYARRYEILLRKLQLEKQYDGTALLLSSEQEGRLGNFTEPSEDLSMGRFLTDLGKQTVTYRKG